MDLVDAIQCTSGSESEKAKKKPVEGGRRRVAVVEMVAGGWSFAARDQDGAVYVWGRTSFLDQMSSALI
jgi:alpha-tubulin suppressor-like RCC1 family protein